MHKINSSEKGAKLFNKTSLIVTNTSNKAFSQHENKPLSLKETEFKICRYFEKTYLRLFK